MEKKSQIQLCYNCSTSFYNMFFLSAAPGIYFSGQAYLGKMKPRIDLYVIKTTPAQIRTNVGLPRGQHSQS